MTEETVPTFAPPDHVARVEPHLPPLPRESFDGLMIPGSTVWRVNGEVALLLGWGRAILLQLAHPGVAAGVAQHSRFDAGPLARFVRLQRTLGTMLQISFGTTDEAVAATRRVDRIHDRVKGILVDEVAGAQKTISYAAQNPALLRWVHATLVHSFLQTYELFVEPLAPAEKDRYCADLQAIGPLLGVPDGYLPTGYAELLSYMNGMLASGDVQVGDTARTLAGHLLAPLPVPMVKQPLTDLLTLPIVGLLPEDIRDAYGFPWDDRRERHLLLLASASRILHRRLPARLHRWPQARRAAERFERSLAG